MNSTARERFLEAYRKRPTISEAARLAGVHRSSVYRWKRDPAFVTAMKAAWQVWHQGHLARYQSQEAEQQRRRAARWAELRPQFQQLAANARAAKRR